MTPEEITSLFATAANTFQPIVGQPTDDDLTALRDILYPLLLDIPFDERIDGHNLVGLIEPSAAYAARWGGPFPRPVRPPAYPALADDATTVVRERSKAEHEILVRDYASFEAAERAVAKFLREAVDEIWYKDLKHPRSYYVTITATQLMEHLNTNCAGMHPSELVTLPTSMQSFYAEAEGIPEFINMLEDSQRKLARANLPMTDAQLLAIASTQILASDHFPRPTDEWEARPVKTWAAWKVHYRAAHVARKRQLLAVANSATNGAANATTSGAYAVMPDDPTQMETLDRLDGYLDNLAAAATTDNRRVELLMQDVTSLTASVASLAAAYTLLAAGKPGPKLPGTGTPAGTKPIPHYIDPKGYCWSHGYRVRRGHDSITCKEKLPGHKDGATRSNTMNGSVVNKGFDAA